MKTAARPPSCIVHSWKGLRNSWRRGATDVEIHEAVLNSISPNAGGSAELLRRSSEGARTTALGRGAREEPTLEVERTTCKGVSAECC